MRGLAGLRPVAARSQVREGLAGPGRSTGSCGAWGPPAVAGPCFSSPCGGAAARARKPSDRTRLREGLS